MQQRQQSAILAGTMHEHGAEQAHHAPQALSAMEERDALQPAAKGALQPGASLGAVRMGTGAAAGTTRSAAGAHEASSPFFANERPMSAVTRPQVRA